MRDLGEDADEHDAEHDATDHEYVADDLAQPRML